jgi:hypothetical protein
MIRDRKGVCLVVVCLGLLVAWGCSRGPSRIKPPAISASSSASAAMAKYDTNHDGSIKGEELDKAPALKGAVKNLEADKTGAVTADKIEARIKKWQESRIGLMSFSCTIKLNGQPLPGAKVTLVPEEFLGADLKPATGTTEEHGVAILSVDRTAKPELPPGVPCGFYRVEVSKMENGTETIPAKYNKETTLGVEVAQDSEALLTGTVFELTTGNAKPGAKKR